MSYIPSTSSVGALQRVMVRMLFDPAFADRVYSDPVAALGGIEVTERHRAFLVAPDRRAWATDPHRRHRALSAIAAELPASCAVAARGAGTGHALESFFAARAFHACIQEGGSLVGAFAGWLGREAHRFGARGLRDLAVLEGAVVALRRRAALSVELSPGFAASSVTVESVEVGAGTLLHYDACMALLRRHPGAVAEAVFDLQLALPEPGIGREPEHLVAELHLGAGEVSISVCGPELHTLLCAAREPVAMSELLGVVRSLGADEGEERAVLDDLASDGLLSIG
jgi:hypothetical protein